LAQQLRKHGHRVLVHDFGAKPANAPALHEFEHIADLAELKNRKDVKLAVVCCPWPQYRDLDPGPDIKVYTPWAL
jgi:UDPglucose 6-dehydrogenase